MAQLRQLGEGPGVFAVNIVAGRAEGADAAAVEWHGDHTIAHLDAPGLGHGHDLAGGLVAEHLGGLPAQVALILRAHRGGVDLNHHPVFKRLEVGLIHQRGLPLAGNGNLFHMQFSKMVKWKRFCHLTTCACRTQHGFTVGFFTAQVTEFLPADPCALQFAYTFAENMKIKIDSQLDPEPCKRVSL